MATVLLFSVPISRQVTTVRKWRRMREPPKNRALITIRFRMRRRWRNRKKSSHELGPKRGEKKKCGGGFLDERIYLEHSHLIKRQTIWLPAAPTAIQTNIISNSNDHSIISRMSSFFRENEVAFMYLHPVCTMYRTYHQFFRVLMWLWDYFWSFIIFPWETTTIQLQLDNHLM